MRIINSEVIKNIGLGIGIPLAIVIHAFVHDRYSYSDNERLDKITGNIVACVGVNEGADSISETGYDIICERK